MTFKKLSSLTLVLALTASLLVGCGTSKDTLASFKGGSITTSELGEELNLNKILYQYTYGTELSDEELKSNLDAIVDTMAETDILYLEAEKEKLTVSDEEFKDSKDAIESMLKEHENLKKAAEEAGLTQDKVEENVKKNLLASKYYDDMVKNIAISEKDLEEYYAENKEELYSPKYADAAHILITTVDDSFQPFSEKEKAAAKKEAEEVLAKAKAGEDFNKLAKEYSSDYDVTNGAELGKFYEGDMVAEFEKAAFSLEEGEISGLVETPFGYHIIKLNSKGTDVLKYSDISNDVRVDLLNTLVSENLQELRSKYNLKTYTEDLKSVSNSLKIVPISKETTKSTETTDEKKSTETKDKKESTETKSTETKDSDK